MKRHGISVLIVFIASGLGCGVGSEPEPGEPEEEGPPI